MTRKRNANIFIYLSANNWATSILIVQIIGRAGTRELKLSIAVQHKACKYVKRGPQCWQPYAGSVRAKLLKLRQKVFYGGCDTAYFRFSLCLIIQIHMYLTWLFIRAYRMGDIRTCGIVNLPALKPKDTREQQNRGDGRRRSMYIEQLFQRAFGFLSDKNVRRYFFSSVESLEMRRTDEASGRGSRREKVKSLGNASHREAGFKHHSQRAGIVGSGSWFAG